MTNRYNQINFKNKDLTNLVNYLDKNMEYKKGDKITLHYIKGSKYIGLSREHKELYLVDVDANDISKIKSILNGEK